MRNRTTIAGLGLAAGMMVGGCYGATIRENAVVSASRDHACSRDMISIEEDVSSEEVYAFWVRTCGQRLLYVHRPIPGEEGTARFYDETAQALLRRRHRR